MGRQVLKFDYEFDFDLIGISCHSKDYRLCWHLNNVLQFHLIKEGKAIEIPQKKENGMSLHSHYSYLDEDAHINIHLLANRSPNGYLLQEEKRADYLLVLMENVTMDLDDLIPKIREIPIVLTAYSINPNDLKSKENLLIL